MSSRFRHPEILAIARSEGKVVVEDLAQRFGVTLQTIRRDLADLADAGQLARVHGGAVLPLGVANIGYADRQQMHAAAKEAIGRACAAEIPDACSLFLTIGTTTEAVARALLAHRDLLVVTNNLNIANILVANPQIEVVVAGGTLRRTDGGLVGPTAVRLIEQFKVDLAVMGCSALDQDGDMLDFDSAEVAVSQTIIAQARQRVLVADHSKIGRKAPIRVAPLSQMAKLYTEAPLPAPLAAKCAAWGTQIVVAPPLA